MALFPEAPLLARRLLRGVDSHAELLQALRKVPA
jgi:hypothetical protein